MNFPDIISKVFAQTPQGTTIKIDNPLCSGAGCTIMGILEKISLYLLWIGAPIVTIMIIYGAFLVMTAGGDPKKVTDGTHSIVYSAVGYGIILIAWGIVSLTKELLTIL